jgi:hypothetical protein
MVGNAKTVNRGENVKRVPSTPNASGTVQTAENWRKQLKLGKTVVGNAKTVNRAKT